MAQAFLAMMRGETPQNFLQSLAQTNPRLQELDLNNPDKAAQDLYAQKGQDYNAAKTSIMERISQFIAK